MSAPCEVPTTLIQQFVVRLHDRVEPAHDDVQDDVGKVLCVVLPQPRIGLAELLQDALPSLARRGLPLEGDQRVARGQRVAGRRATDEDADVPEAHAWAMPVRGLHARAAPAGAAPEARATAARPIGHGCQLRGRALHGVLGVGRRGLLEAQERRDDAVVRGVLVHLGPLPRRDRGLQRYGVQPVLHRETPQRHGVLVAAGGIDPAALHPGLPLAEHEVLHLRRRDDVGPAHGQGVVVHDQQRGHRQGAVAAGVVEGELVAE
mmetsp:Transcript_28827/g.89722  ORF Transcript_28827/g.89722 Transcript_28827/m.89722 type:complete len:262 (-) Transcript_28827:799-1584(-)